MRDIYLYKNSNVLKNKLGIKDAAAFEKAEVNLTCNAIYELEMSPLPGSYDYFSHYCAVHQYIFRDVYDWAGVPRTVPMEKGEAMLGYMSIEYAKPEKIRSEGEAVLERMNSRKWDKMDIPTQAKYLAADMADLWKVHSFREGNTRTTVTFMCQFADSHNMPVERTLFEKNSQYVRNALVAATAVYADADFRKPEFLEKIVQDGLERAAERRVREEKPTEKTVDETEYVPYWQVDRADDNRIDKDYDR